MRETLRPVAGLAHATWPPPATPYSYGLVEIHHGWESGMDDSPRWDAPYANVHPQPDLPPFVRADLAHVADPSQRPTDAEYARYLWLLEQKVRSRYDDAVYRSTGDFVVGDVLVSALLAAASDLLADMGEELGIGGGAAGGVEQSRAIARRFRTGRAALGGPGDRAGPRPRPAHRRAGWTWRAPRASRRCCAAGTTR